MSRLKVRRTSRGRIVRLLLAVVLVTAGLRDTHAFVVSDDTRCIPPEKLAALRDLQVAIAPAPAHRSVFWYDRLYETYSSDTFVDGMSQSLTSGTGSFAFGAGVGAVAMLFSASADAGSRIRIGRAVDNYFAAMGPPPDLQREQDAWRAALVSGIQATGRAELVVHQLRRERKDRIPRGGGCPVPDHCLEIEPLWGFSSDGAHIDFMVLLRIWSPHLRKPGRRARREPDYANAVIFRSDAMRLPEPKTDADREALLQAARASYERLGLPALQEKMKSRRPQLASAARREAFPLLSEHAARVKEAKADAWAPEARRYRQAQLWGDNESAAVRAAFAAAAAGTPRLLQLELSEAGQSVKEPRPYFLARGEPEDAQVMEGDERQLVYLDDGRLVSRLVGEATYSRWSLRVSEAPQRRGLPGK